MHTAAKQILTLAANDAHYFDLSDGEKLVWMIEQAYRLGRKDFRKRRSAKRNRDAHASKGRTSRR